MLNLLHFGKANLSSPESGIHGSSGPETNRVELLLDFQVLFGSEPTGWVCGSLPGIFDRGTRLKVHLSSKLIQNLPGDINK